MDSDLAQHIQYHTVDTSDWSDEIIYHYANRIETGKYMTTNSIDRLCAMTSPDLMYPHTKTEILDHGRWIKPFFDLDVGLPPKTRVTKKLILKHLIIGKTAIDTFFKLFDPNFNFMTDLVIAQRHGIKVKEDKEVPSISFHFVVNNGTRTKMEHMDQIMKDFHCLNSVFDTSVYNDGRKFCMVFGKKMDKDLRRKMPLNGEHKDHIIQHVPKEYNKVLKYVSRCSVEVEDRNGKKSIRDIPELGDIKPYTLPENMDYHFDKYDVEEVVKRIPNNKNFEDWNVYLSLAYALKECGQLKQTPLSKDDLLRIFHRFSATHAKYNAAAVDKIWARAKTHHYDLGIFYLHKLLELNYPGFWKTYYLNNGSSSIQMDTAENILKYSEFYNTTAMTRYPSEDYTIVAVKAATGCGKTVQLLDTLERLNPLMSVCVISYNRVLCRKYHSMFKHLGFDLYSDLPTGPIRSHRLVICLDSLERLRDNTFYDYVIIDEALSVFEHFDSDTMKDPSAIATVLTKMLLITSQLLMLDAYIDSLTVYDVVKWLERKRGVKAYWIWNKYIRETNRKSIFISGESTTKFISHVCAELKEGNRIVCPVSSKSTGQKLYDVAKTMFPELKIKFYHSESSRAELHRDSMNTNEAWKDVHLLIYTPTISAGVSFELPWFDKLIAFFESDLYHASVSTCFQQLFRVRQLLSGDMIIYTDVTEFTNLTVADDEIENHLQHKCKNVSRLFSSLTDVDTNGDYCFKTDTMSFQILKNNILSRNKSLMYFTTILEKALVKYNIPVKHVTKCPEKVDQQMEKDITTSVCQRDTSLLERYTDAFRTDKRSLVLPDEQMKDVDMKIRRGVEDIDEDTLIKRNITMNLGNWKASIHNITDTFYSKYILTTNSKEQRKANDEYIKATRFRRMGDAIEVDMQRLQIMMNNRVDNNMNVYRNLQKTGMQQIIVAKQMLRHVFEMTDFTKLKDNTIKYKNTYWKPRLVAYLKSIHGPEFLLILQLFDLNKDRTTKKGEMITYKKLSEYEESGSHKPTEFIKKIMQTTFGVSVVTSKRKDKIYFDTQEWASVLNDNRTFLNTVIPRTKFYELDQCFDIDETHEAELAQAYEQQQEQTPPRPVNFEEENTNNTTVLRVDNAKNNIGVAPLTREPEYEVQLRLLTSFRKKKNHMDLSETDEVELFDRYNPKYSLRLGKCVKCSEFRINLQYGTACSHC